MSAVVSGAGFSGVVSGAAAGVAVLLLARPVAVVDRWCPRNAPVPRPGPVARVRGRAGRVGRSARRRELAEQARVAQFAAALAAEVGAGRAARAAVLAALGDDVGGSWPAAVRAAAADGDVAAALLAGAGEPGADGLRDLAACWQVAERTGAGLARGLEAIADAADRRAAHRDRIGAELAGVRASGWLLAALPLLGVALGGTAGAAPWRVLVSTPPGLVLLGLGVALDLAGLAWLRRMARHAAAAA